MDDDIQQALRRFRQNRQDVIYVFRVTDARAAEYVRTTFPGIIVIGPEPKNQIACAQIATMAETDSRKQE